MKKTIITTLLLFIMFQMFAQNINSRLWDPKVKKNVLVGECNRKAFLDNEFGIYYKSEYERYQPSDVYINKLKEKINGVDIVIIFGEWCSDSQMQVPRFMKILDRSGLPVVNLKIYGVNREKKAIVTSLDKYKVERVPTFIVFQDGVELGRIVETPKTTLEKDLWKIVKKAHVIKNNEDK